IFFAVATVFSSFGTGNLPQINSISNSIFETFGLKQIITGAVLTVLLALVIIGGIKRIVKVTSKLVPAMAIIYFLGAILVIFTNYENIIPSFISIFKDVFTSTAAGGGFLGGTFAIALSNGVNRGLFSNEAGQGSAPIAHSAARAHEPVSEGIVALLGPFIDTICICTLTGLVLLSSGIWREKLDNQFQYTDMEIVTGIYDDSAESDRKKLLDHFEKTAILPLYSGQLEINEGTMANKLTILNSRSVAENVVFYEDGNPYTGSLLVENGKVSEEGNIVVRGKSLMHSAPLTTVAYERSFLGKWGKYIVSLGLLLFAFSTSISWSYYGDRAVTFLFGPKYVIMYRIIYVVAFFFASFTDTTIIWSVSYITIVLMTIPNLLGILILHREIKSAIKQYWVDFKTEHPEEKAPG
ncbi:MAG: amino acid carrier protein, partial [Bacteroidales bacterium]|nr:amino acid carrier protein [Bacteroidales bacterium]